jgi:transposase
VARARSPDRDKAFELWKSSGGTMKLKEIADALGVSEGTVRGWKAKDEWDSRLNETLQLERNAPNETERSGQVLQNEKSISWLEIETEYVTDIRKKPCTLKELSEKYRVPFQTIKEYASKNKWTEKRNKHRTTVVQKTVEKTAEIISDDIAKATARHFLLSSKLLDVIERALSDPDEFYRIVEKLRTGYGPGEFDEKIVTEVVDALNDSKLLNVVNALEKVQKMQRQTLGILDEKDRQKLDIEMYKLMPQDEEEDTEDDGFLDALKGIAKEVWTNDTSEE